MAIYIAHSRTKGSKNGVRRYQNPDGTWTDLGLERRRAKYDAKNGSKRNASKNDLISEMTDEELRQRINRLRDEATYKQLMSDLSRAKAGKEKVKEILAISGSVVGVAAGSVALVQKIKKLMG